MAPPGYHSSQASSEAIIVGRGAQLPSRPQSGCSCGDSRPAWPVHCITDAGAAPLSTPATPTQVCRIDLCVQTSGHTLASRVKHFHHAWAGVTYHTSCST